MNAERVVAVFLAGLVLGALLVAGAVGALDPGAGEYDPAQPPYSVSSGTGCVDATTPGWLHAVAADERTFVSGNLTVRHDADEIARARLVRATGGVYALHVTVESTDKQGAPPAGCTTGTTLEFAATLPANATELRVTHGGSVVTTLDLGKEGAVAHERVRTIDAANATARTAMARHFHLPVP